MSMSVSFGELHEIGGIYNVSGCNFFCLSVYLDENYKKYGGEFSSTSLTPKSLNGAYLVIVMLKSYCKSLKITSNKTILKCKSQEVRIDAIQLYAQWCGERAYVMVSRETLNTSTQFIDKYCCWASVTKCYDAYHSQA